MYNICFSRKACIYWYAEQTIPNYTFCDLTISSILAHASTKGNKRKRILPKGRRFYAMKIAKNLFKMQKKMKPNMEMTFLRHFVIERQVAEFNIYILRYIFSTFFSIFVELSYFYTYYQQNRVIMKSLPYFSYWLLNAIKPPL